MERKMLEETYNLFFSSGGYKIGKLLVIKSETPYEGSNDDYDLISIFRWKNHESGDPQYLIKKIHKNLQNQIKDIRTFMFALYDAMLRLPIDEAELIDVKYGRDEQARERPSDARRLKNEIFPALYTILFDSSVVDYDFSVDGLFAIEQIDRIVDMGKTSALSFADEAETEDMIFPIENAMEAARAFKKPEFQVFTDDIMELSLQVEDEDNIKASLPVKIKRAGKYFHIYTLEIDYRYVERYIYQLYGDGKLISMGLYPDFTIPADKIKALKDVDSLKIMTKPKGFIGEEYIPDELTEGKITRFYMHPLAQICDYVLYEDGKEIARSRKPEINFRKKPGAKYRFRIEKNDQYVDDILTIKRAVAVLPTKAGIERKTDVGSSNNFRIQMYDLALSMELMKKYLPHKFADIMKYRDNNKIERRVNTFWELSCLLINPSFINDTEEMPG